MPDQHEAPQYTWMTQMVVPTATREEAEQLLPAIVAQEGCRGARVIGGTIQVGSLTCGKETAVQAFFDDAAPGAQLPDGWRRVMVSPAILATCTPTSTAPGAP